MKKILFLIFFVQISFLGNAQSLENLCKEASDNNPELKALYQEYLAALEKSPQVGELTDPEVQLGLFVLPVETRLGPQWVRLGATQMFPWKGTLQARQEVMNAIAKTKFERIAVTRLNLFFEIKKSWLEYYELDKSKELVDRNLRNYKVLKDLALAKVESGKASTTDVLRVDLKIQELEQDLVILDNQKQKPLASLNRILNRSLTTPLVIVENLNATRIPFQKDTLLANIQANHPVLKMLFEQQVTAQKEIALNELNGKPSFGVGLDYIMVGKRSDANPSNNGRDIIAPKASMKIPLYKKKYPAKQREEELKIAALEFQKEDTQARFMAIIEQAYIDEGDVYLKLELYEKLIAITNSAIRILETEYATSGKNFEEFLRLQNELVEYDRKILSAIVKSHLAKASVERFVLAQ